MSRAREVRKYYEQVAAPAYDRWQGGLGGYHFGFFDSSEAVSSLSNLQPEEISSLHRASHRRMFEVVTDFIAPQEEEMVLDNGCGEGGMFAFLESGGARVIGLNIVPEHLRRAQQRIKAEKLSRTNLIQGDFSHIPLAPATIDKVLFFESLTHSPDQKRTLEEASRVMTNNGEIVIVEPMLVKQQGQLGMREQQMVQQINQGMALEVTSLPTLTTLLTELGLEIVMIDDITKNVLPSIQLAAASAEAHQGEDASDDLIKHRQATIAYRDLTILDEMKYVLIKVRKSQK